MREILFRGKGACGIHKGKWAIGWYALSPQADPVIYDLTDPAFAVLVDPETVGQFTGLLDKHGKEIYEGDIVVLASKFYSKQYRGVIYWNDKLCAWKLKFRGGDLFFGVRNAQASFACEVIGSIHDNPELLEAK